MEHHLKTFNDFPRKGVAFKDISPLLANVDARTQALEKLEAEVGQAYQDIDLIAGIDARGFIVASFLAERWKKPMVMIRKPNKLPDMDTVSYTLEYGTNTLGVLRDAIPRGSKVLIADDLLATGGSAKAAVELVERHGSVAGLVFLVEMCELQGRQRLQYPVYSAIQINPSTNTMPWASRLVPHRPTTRPRKTEPIQTLMMYHPTMAGLAQNMLARTRGSVRQSVVHWEYFADGWPNITFEPLDTLQDKDVVFLMNVSTKELFVEQQALLVALPRQFIRSLTIVVPYLAPSTHERVDQEGVLATVEPVLKMISCPLPMTKTGPPMLLVYDIHALQIRFYPTDSVRLKLVTAMPLLKQHIDPLTCTIVFPDDGARKRFHHDFDLYRVVVCNKVRDGDARVIRMTDKYNWPVDHQQAERALDHAVIVDDLVQTGGTIRECAKMLKQHGFKKVSAYTTHAVFPNRGHLKFVDDDCVDHFYVTNSNVGVAKALQPYSKFTVLDLSDSLCKELGWEVSATPEVNVYLASTNDNKLECIRMSCSAPHNLFGVRGCKSSVNEQPLSKEETERGARNRLQELVSTCPDSGIYLAVESGIFGGYDQACIVGCNSTNKDNVRLVWGDPVKVPAHLVRYIPQDGKITFGSTVERLMGWKRGCWHQYVDPARRSRAQLMQGAMQTLLQDLCEN